MPPQPGSMRNRWTAYAGVSTALAAGVILKALAQRPNFYSAAVYLWQSSANLMILCNLLFVTACTFLLFLQKLLYGPLRPIEVEQLYEKAWFAVTETCLAMTIFRGEIGTWFLVMFFSLLTGKVWGWIGEGRVEVLEQQQHNILGGRSAGLFHTRLAMSLALSVCFDLTMLEYVVGQVLHMARPDMMVMFGFEFAVLSITSLSTATRYALNLIEMGIVRKQKQKRIDAIRKERIDVAVREVQADPQTQSPDTNGATSEQPESPDLIQRRAQAAVAAASQPIDEAEIEVEGWEGKGRWVFYLDLATDFFKLVVYLSFFFILLIFYGLPLHIMRDVFLTCRSFFKRIGDFLRYRTATRDMNERYPDATEAEIGREDVCIICREDMRPYVPPAQGAAPDPVAERMRPKKLPCGHVLHFSCLRSWLERQQICPTCRATVVPTPQTRPGAAGPAAGQPGAPRAQHQPNGGNGRPRVYQFGPLRIGVGAARGNNMFEELEQQLANIDPPAAQGQNDNGPQQYGFGIRWDGIRRRAQGQRRAVRGSIEDQLNAAEQQIQREVDTLQASMGELQALRNVQAQLARIRMARQAAGVQPQPQTTVQPLPTANSQVRPTLPTVTPLASGAQPHILESGSEELPQGLTLPEGWSMMPLQPIQAQAMPGQAVFNSMQLPPQFAGLAQPPFGGHPGTAGPPLQHADLSGVLRHGHEMHRGANVQPESLTASQPAQEQATTTENSSQQSNQRQTPSRPPELERDPRSAIHNLLNNSTSAQTGAQNSRSLQVTSPAQRTTPALHQSQTSQRQSQGASSATTSTRQAQAQIRQVSLPPNSPSSPSPRAAQNTSTTTTSNAAPPILPTRQLNPTTTNGVRTTSPHRPTRSIGSSWGFAGVEDVDDSESTSESEDDTEAQPMSKKPDSSTRVATRGASGTDQRTLSRSKKPTVEDTAEDPD